MGVFRAHRISSRKGDGLVGGSRARPSATMTVNEALAQQHHLRRPIAIQVRPTGQYTEITAVRFM